MEKIYISGPITNNPLYKDEFTHAESELLYMGYDHISPIGEENPEYSWRDYMRRDIKLLMDADGIYMLKGWRRSKGARLEWKIAKALDLEIIYQK